MKKLIKEKIKTRYEFLVKYDNSYDENTREHSIEEPKEIDELSLEIYNTIKDNQDSLEVDFIIESLTELGSAPNILYDDNGNFAVVGDGFQTVSYGNEPVDIEMSFFIEKDKWKKTIREAIKIYLNE